MALRPVILGQAAIVRSVLAAGEVQDRLTREREARHALDLEHPSRTESHRRMNERRVPSAFGFSAADFGVSAADRGEWDRLRAMGLSPNAAAIIVRAGRENTGGAA